jgi:hypothetical protein
MTITAEPAAVARAGRLSTAGRRLLQPAMPPTQYVAALIAAGEHGDALRFLAYGLPPRPAVWWACLCVRKLAGAPLPSDEHEVLGLVVRHLAEPSEEGADAIGRTGSALGEESPLRWLSQAVGAPPTEPTRVGDGVLAAVCLAAARADGGVEPHRHCADLGLWIARGDGPPLPQLPANPAPLRPPADSSQRRGG